MKTSLRLLLLATIVVVLQNCAEEQELSPEKVSIYFQLASGSSNPSGAELPETGTLLINIENGSGESALESASISFSKEGDRYATEPLALPPGNYVITDFMVLGKDAEVRFAAPKSNAPLARKVAHALSYNFTVSPDAVSDIRIEVLDIARHTSREFGYESFLNSLRKGFSVIVFTKDSALAKLATADAYILKENDTLRHYDLRKGVNLIFFNGTAGETYTLVVIKDGYSRYTKTFTPESLWTEQHGRPIKAVLVPALTLVAVTDANGYFGFELDGFLGSITIDWGDGTSEPIPMGDPGELDVVRDHTYAEPGKYFVSVTGELGKIHLLIFGGGGGPSFTDRINTSKLSGLTDLRFMYTHVPRHVDASKNHKLDFLVFWNTDARFIKISREEPPLFIELEGSSQITTAAFDGIIDDVYDYTLRTNTSVVFISWHYTIGTETYPIGPPSPETLEKMRILQNVYDVEFGPPVE
jgi:hypothetical protein